MKISDVESSRASEIYAVNRPQTVAGPSGAQPDANNGGGGPAATVQLSQQAQSFAVARQAVNAVPETRDDLVARLKSQIDSGTYHVSSSDIADQMVRRAQADQIR